MESEYERIEVKVPSSRVPEFYEMYGRWLAAAPVGLSDTEPDADRSSSWTSSDEELATTYWAKLTPTARAIFKVMMAEPGRRFPGDEIAAEIGQSKGSFGVAGALAWPGRHAYAMGRSLPFEWEPDSDERRGGYWMSPDVADLFRRATSAVG